jgi:hypothetical protein
MPTWSDKNQGSKAAATAATKRKFKLSVATLVCNDSELVAFSATIAASIHYKCRMYVLMKEAEMYFCLGEKEKGDHDKGRAYVSA